MVWSYNYFEPGDLDRVRLYIGDTDENNQQLQDEEIAILLATEGAVIEGAIACADALAAKYARLVDTAVEGDVNTKLMQLQTSYEKLADRLRRKLTRRGVPSFAGGLTKSARDAKRTDAEAIGPVFSRDMETEPGTEGGENIPLVPSPFPFY